MAQLRNLTFVYDITLHSIFIKSLEFVTLYLKVFLSIKQNFYFYAVAVTWRLHIKKLLCRILPNSCENICDGFKMKLLKKTVSASVFF